MSEPKEIISGFNYEWEESLSDYPADQGYTLKYKGLNSAGKIEITSEADGANHVITLTNEITAAYVAGKYKFTKYVTDSENEPFVISEFYLEIKPNPILANTLDTRTHARIMLEKIEAFEQGKGLQKSFSIAGRAIEYYTPDELLKWKNHYKRIVFAEEGKIINKKRLTTFKDPFSG